MLEDVTILDDEAADEVVARPRATRAVRPVEARHARDRFNTLPKVAIAFRNSSAKQKLEMKQLKHRQFVVAVKVVTVDSKWTKD